MKHDQLPEGRKPLLARWKFSPKIFMKSSSGGEIFPELDGLMSFLKSDPHPDRVTKLITIRVSKIEFRAQISMIFALKISIYEVSGQFRLVSSVLESSS